MTLKNTMIEFNLLMAIHAMAIIPNSNILVEKLSRVQVKSIIYGEVFTEQGGTTRHYTYSQ